MAEIYHLHVLFLNLSCILLFTFAVKRLFSAGFRTEAFSKQSDQKSLWI